MLSTRPLQSAAATQRYFIQEGQYYTQTNDQQQRGQWYGKGALTLGLETSVDPQTFAALLAGKLPNGEQMGKRCANGQIRHRPGYDLTFSAPKSVSIMALVGGDTRILTAFDAAVKKTLDLIESKYAQARITQGGITEYENTHNLVSALFTQTCSRANDPQLHTHCVVLNMTKRQDTKWRALATAYPDNQPNTGFWEQITRGAGKAYLGIYFRAELAYRLEHELGYRLDIKPQGFFEIQGIPDTLIDHFSKRRRQDIEPFLKQHGLTGAKAAALATVLTRPPKNEPQYTALQAQWQAQTQHISPNLDFNNLSNTQAIPPTTPDLAAIKAIHYAIDHASDTQVILSEPSLIQTAWMHAGLNQVTLAQLEQAMNHCINSQLLCPLPQAHRRPDSPQRFITQQTLQIEQALLTHINAMQPSRPLITPSQNLPPAAQAILSSKTPCYGITGGTPTQHIDLCRSIISTLRTQKHLKILPKYTVFGITPHARQIPALEKQTACCWYSTIGAIAQIKKSLTHHHIGHKNAVVFLLEAQRLPADQWLALIELRNTIGFRLYCLGNQAHLTQRNSAIFHLLLNAGFPHHRLTHQPQPHNHTLIEIQDRSTRDNTIAKHYANLPPHQQQAAFVIMPTQAQCHPINTQIRQHLNLYSSQPYTTLQPHNLPKAKARHPQYYQPGQWLRFYQDHPKQGIQRYQYYRITRIEPNALQLQVGKRTIAWHPQTSVDIPRIYQEQTLSIGIGERLLITQAISKPRLRSGQIITVIALDAHSIHFLQGRHKKATLDLNTQANQHIQYAYSATPQSLPYLKPTHLIAYHSAFSQHAAQRRFVQWLNDQPASVTLYTDNQQAFDRQCQAYSRPLGTLETALEKHHLPKPTLDQHTPLTAALTKKQHNERTQLHHIRTHKTPKHLLAQDALHDASEHLSAREAAFTQESLESVTMTYALGQIHDVDIAKALAIALTQKKLQQGNDMLATQAMLTLEKNILAQAKAAQHQSQPLSQTIKSPPHLTPEQQTALKQILQSPDRILLLQGHAGTGKTTLLISVQDHLPGKLFALAPTHPAVKELTTRTIPAKTLARCLVDIPYNPLEPDQFLIIDEASLVSNHALQKLFTLTQKHRLLIVGDQHQHGAIESGKPFGLLQKALPTITLATPQRQKNPHLHQAVQAHYANDWHQVITHLQAHHPEGIVEIREEHYPAYLCGNKPPLQDTIGFYLYSQEGKTYMDVVHPGKVREIVRLDYQTYRFPAPGKIIPHPLSEEATESLTRQCQYQGNQIAQQYLSNTYLALDKPTRQNTLVIALSNWDVNAINTAIHEGLAKEGTLTGNPTQTPILTSCDLTDIEAAQAMHYQVGDILQTAIRLTIAEHTLPKETYLTIENIDKKRNWFILSTPEGQQLPYYLDKKKPPPFACYRQEERTLQIGEQLRWTRSHPTQNRLGGDTFTLTNLTAQHATIHTPQGTKTLTLTNRADQHWEYAYVSTTYGAQGKTSDNVLLLMQSYWDHLTNQASLLVAISRPRHNLQLVTDNLGELLKKITTLTGKNLSALEALTPPAKPPKHTPNPPPEKQPYFELSQVNARLHANTEAFLQHFMGPPRKRTPHEWRYGSNKGSLVVTLKGQYRGLWRDFQTDEHGNLLQLLQRTHHQPFKEALKTAAQWLSIPSTTPQHRPKTTTPRKEPTITQDQQKRIQRAQAIAQQSHPIHNTLAARYLQTHRGLSTPNTLRFHPNLYSGINKSKNPALLALGYDPKGNLQVVQATYLNPHTAQKANLNTTKQTFGVLKGSHVPLNPQPTAPITAFAEGIETALSILQAHPHWDVRATLGISQFAHIPTTKTAPTVILCLDNDPHNPTINQTITTCQNQLQAAGKTVHLTQPKTLKTDFNDLLRSHGINAVRQRVAQDMERGRER